MKIKQETVDQTLPVALALTTPELGTFTITGSYTDVEPYVTMTAQEAPQQPSQPKSHNVASYALQATVEPANGLRADIRAAVHDFRFGTHFLSALHEQRQLRRDLAMAQSLGLLAVPVCAKHRESLAAVKALR